jgi:AcrR family transcriptional regulator
MEDSMTNDEADGSVPRAVRSERTRLRIFDAAEEVFGSLGYHDASIVDITRAAGVAPGTFYVHFASKVELFRQLVRVRRAELQDVARKAAYKHEGGRKLVHAGFKAWFTWVAKHPSILRVMREAEFVETSLIEDLYRIHAREQAEGLQRSLDAGRVDPIDPEVVAWCLVGMVETVALRWIVWEGGKPIPPERLDAFVDTALRAMGFPATEAAPSKA